MGTRRFERLLERIVGVFGLLFALQTADSFVADRLTSSAGGLLVACLVLASLLTGLVGGLAPRAARPVLLAAFLFYVAALLVWPFTIDGPVPVSPMPWLAAMSPVATAYLVVAVRSWFVPVVAQSLMGAAVACVLFLVGGMPQADASLNGAFVSAVAVVIIVLLGGVRRSVAAADRAQRAALDRYASSRLDDALEAERTRTDALVHDSVLMTFLAAANAHDTGSEALAERNARNALRVLARIVDPALQGPAVPLARVLSAAEPAIAPLVEHVDLRIDAAWHLMLPETVAEAMVGAMTQAMVNSVRHAGDPTFRTARMEPWGADGLRVVVEDDGRGFDPAEVSPERLGVRRSILERVQQVGGTARLDSAPGCGTRVTLTFGSLDETDDGPLPERREAEPVGA